MDPLPISLIAGRYLIFDNGAVNYLRRTHNICGVLIGILPQVPQQNLFLGLPLELLPEEAKVLVQKGVVYILDPLAWHKENMRDLAGADRFAYLESIRVEGRKAQLTAEKISQSRAKRGLAKQTLLYAAKEYSPSKNSSQGVSIDEVTAPFQKEHPDSEMFDSRRPTLSHTLPTMKSSSAASALTVTLTSTYVSQLPSQNSPQNVEPHVPASYPLFAHLHAHNYFITPGLRFGCDYAVYPGDPLRFHSHFLAVCHNWGEEIPLVDLIGGGRLGTGVKKGFLIGAEPPETCGVAGAVRTFCIEWGGM